MKKIIEVFYKFESISNNVLAYITNIMLVLLTVFVFSQVAARYIFNIYLGWTEEASRYLMIWVVLLGAAKALKENAHPRVTFIVEILPRKAKYLLMILANIISAFFYIIMIVYGYQFSLLNISQLSLSLRIPMGLIFASIPLGGFFLLIVTISDTINNLKHLGVITMEEGE